MTDPKTVARDVATRLSNQLIRIKHVQALDLVAAGAGLANRHVLARMTALPPIKRVNLALLTSAATVLARHDLMRRQYIVDTTSRALLGEREPIISHKSQGGTWEDVVATSSFVSPSAGVGAYVETIRNPDGTTESRVVESVIAYTNDSDETLFWNSDDGWGDFASATRFPDRNVRIPSVGDPRLASTLRWMKVDDAALRAAVDAAVAECDLDTVEEVDPDAPGELALDYERVAGLILRDTTYPRPIGPLEVAVRDGAQRAALYTASLSNDPDSRGGAVIEWIDDVASAVACDRVPSEDALRNLLMEGDGAISNIRNWIEPNDRLWAWLNVAGYPDVLANTPDLEAAGDIPSLAWNLDGDDVVIALRDLARPDHYLQSPAGKLAFDSLVRHAYFTAWEPSREGISRRTANDIAASYIEYFRQAKTDEDRRFAGTRAIAEHFIPGDVENAWYHEGGSEATDRILDALEEGAQEEGLDLAAEGYDRDEWSEMMQGLYEDYLREQDDSTALGMIGSQDRCELLFYIMPKDSSTGDFCEMAGPWPEAKRTVVDERFQFILAKLGYTTSQWRKETGSNEPHRPLRTRPPRGTGQLSKLASSEPLLTIPQIVELLDNNCSQFFNIVIYAIVPLAQLLQTDLRRPIAFSQAAIAAHNNSSGTFQDIIVKREVIMQDGLDGELHSTECGYSPEDIVGLHAPAFYADVYDPEARMLGDAATIEMDALLAVDGLVRSQPGIRPNWQMIDANTIRVEVGVYDATRGYSLKAMRATFESTKTLRPEVDYE